MYNVSQCGNACGFPRPGRINFSSEYETVAMKRLKHFATEFRTSYQRFPSLPVFALRSELLAQDLLDLETGYLGQERRSIVDLAEWQIDANETMQISASQNWKTTPKWSFSCLRPREERTTSTVALAKWSLASRPNIVTRFQFHILVLPSHQEPAKFLFQQQ
jgi:hypothetical protein